MELYSLLQGFDFKVHVPVIGIRAILGMQKAHLGKRPVGIPDLLNGTEGRHVRRCQWYDAKAEVLWRPHGRAYVLGQGSVVAEVPLR